MSMAGCAALVVSPPIPCTTCAMHPPHHVTVLVKRCNIKFHVSFHCTWANKICKLLQHKILAYRLLSGVKQEEAWNAQWPRLQRCAHPFRT